MVNPSSRRSTIVRWIATAIAFLICAIGVLLPPFACAVGEYEEDNRSCDTPVLQIAAFGVLLAGVIVARVTGRAAPQWLGIGVAVVLVQVGLDGSV
jgi:energy-coupling factor transporter transmembrane protein EcfT